MPARPSLTVKKPCYEFVPYQPGAGMSIKETIGFMFFPYMNIFIDKTGTRVFHLDYQYDVSGRIGPKAKG
jgi:hypothetical protein